MIGSSDMKTVLTDEASQMHDALLQAMPEGAEHDKTLCPFCLSLEKADNSVIPPADEVYYSGGTEKSNITTEPKGGTPHTMDTSNTDNMLERALSDVAAKAQEVLTLKESLEQAGSETARLTQEVAQLTTERDSVQGELDAAKLENKTLSDELTTIKRRELVTKRAQEVAALGLFAPDYITERAEKWGELDEAAWLDRVSEWTNMKPVETASMTGTSETMTSTAKQSGAMRVALGLDF
jgi:hypothetical protein